MGGLQKSCFKIRQCIYVCFKLQFFVGRRRMRACSISYLEQLISGTGGRLDAFNKLFSPVVREGGITLLCSLNEARCVLIVEKTRQHN